MWILIENYLVHQTIRFDQSNELNVNVIYTVSLLKFEWMFLAVNERDCWLSWKLAVSLNKNWHCRCSDLITSTTKQTMKITIIVWLQKISSIIELEFIKRELKFIKHEFKFIEREHKFIEYFRQHWSTNASWWKWTR